MVHPFHIHVNPFMIKQVKSDWPINEQYENVKALVDDEMEPRNKWRDTVIVPAFGNVTIWQCFDAKDENRTIFSGKAVFHCHFLDHEDTGMIHNMVLLPDHH